MLDILFTCNCHFLFPLLISHVPSFKLDILQAGRFKKIKQEKTPVKKSEKKDSISAKKVGKIQSLV